MALYMLYTKSGVLIRIEHCHDKIGFMMFVVVIPEEVLTGNGSPKPCLGMTVGL